MNAESQQIRQSRQIGKKVRQTFGHPCLKRIDAPLCLIDFTLCTWVFILRMRDGSCSS